MLPFKEMWCTVFGFLSTRTSTPPSFPTPTVPTPTWRLSNLLNRDVPGPAPQPFQPANPNEARTGLIIIFSFIGLALGGAVVFIFHQLWAWRARRRAEKLEKENKATGVSPGGLRSAQRTPQLSPAPSGASSAPRSRVPSGAATNASSNLNGAQRTPQMSPAPSGTSSEPRSRVPSGAAPNASASTENQTHNTSTNPTIEEDRLSGDPLQSDDQETIQANREETNVDASQDSQNTIQATEDPVDTPPEDSEEQSEKLKKLLDYFQPIDYPNKNDKSKPIAGTSNVGSTSQQNPADQDAVQIDEEEADDSTVENPPEDPDRRTQQGKNTFRPKKHHTDFPAGGGLPSHVKEILGISGSGSTSQQNPADQDAVQIDKEEADAVTSEATQPDSNHPATEAAAEGKVETSPEDPKKQTQQGKGTFRAKKHHTDFPAGGGLPSHVKEILGISGSGSTSQQNLTEQNPQASTSQQPIEGTENQANPRSEETNPARQNPRGTNNRRRGRGESTTRGRGAGRSQPRK